MQLVFEIKEAGRQDLFFLAMGIEKFAQKMFLLSLLKIARREPISP
jgi:hypothetical protein